MSVAPHEIVTARVRQRRLIGALFLNLTLLGLVGATFYTQDLRYSLPTPKPKHYAPPKPLIQVRLPRPDGRPVLLCFASADCGCTRFNQDHLWALAHQFGKTVRFIEVIESDRADGLDSPGEVLLDPRGTWARACGVYSTPQAVVLDRSDRLVFRGNFNSSRFCAEPSTQYARIVLESVVADRSVPSLPANATIAYGCAIPAAEVNR